jgi:hypothetical protein
MKKVYPFESELYVPHTDTPFSFQFIQAAGKWRILTTPRLLLTLMAVLKLESIGQLKQPGQYKLVFNSFSDVQAYRYLPNNVN